MRNEAALPHKKTARQGSVARQKEKKDARPAYADGDRVSSVGTHSTAADFTRCKMGWLDAIAADPDIPHAAFRVAYVLVSRHLNRKTGTAWPSLATLADHIGTDTRTVGRHIAALVEQGYLLKKRGGDGHANIYSLVSSDRTKLSDLKASRQDKIVRSERRQKVTSDRTNDAFQTGQNCPTNPYIEPSELRGEPYRLPPIEPLENSFGEYEAGGSAPEALPPFPLHDDDLGPGEWVPWPDWEPNNEPDNLDDAPPVVKDFHASLPRALRSALTYGLGGYVFAGEPEGGVARQLLPFLRRFLGEDGAAVVDPFDDRYDLACLLSDAEAIVEDFEEAERSSLGWLQDADPHYA